MRQSIKRESDQVHQRDKDDQHRQNVGEDPDAVLGAAGDRFHEVLGPIGDFKTPGCGQIRVERQGCHGERRGGADDRCHQNVAERIRITGPRMAA